MNRDFTFRQYQHLLDTLQKKGYVFLSFSDYLETNTIKREGEEERRREECGSLENDEASDVNPKSYIRNPKFLILRHDVDAKPNNSLRFARWEHNNGIRGTYYVRTGTNGFDKGFIREIASLGHEIGYHYETLAQAAKLRLAAGNRLPAVPPGKITNLWKAVQYAVKLSRWIGTSYVTKKSPPLDKQTLHHAYQLFTVNLRKLRRLAPVSTICMHGSPLSPFDNRNIWKLYDYRKHDILGEPYLDTDFSQFAYLTDTGRKWNNVRVSFRDKVVDSERERLRDEGTKERRDRVTERQRDGVTGEGMKPGTWNLEFTSTSDIIQAIYEGSFPEKAMLTIHPQRWNDDWFPWLQELILQSIKNPLKRILVWSAD